MKLLCKICQKEFGSFNKLSHHCIKHKLSAKEYYDNYLKKINDGICFKCQSSTKFISLKIGYEKYCSSKQCSMEKKKETCLTKYGSKFYFQTEEHKIKTKKTCLQKYGTKSSNQNKDIKNKMKQTCLTKYGSDYFIKTDKFMKLRTETCTNTYNTIYPQQTKLIKQKTQQTCLKRYGVRYDFQSTDIRNKQKESLIKHYGVDSWAKTEEGRKCSRITAIKHIEEQKLNNEPLMPRIGILERECLNKLQCHTSLSIIRQCPDFRYIIGRIPDGYIRELRLIILFHETKIHYIDDKCLIETEDTIRSQKDYESQGLIVFKISEKEWKENNKSIIEEFINQLHQRK